MNFAAVKTPNAVMNTSVSYKNPVLFKCGNPGGQGPVERSQPWVQGNIVQ